MSGGNRLDELDNRIDGILLGRAFHRADILRAVFVQVFHGVEQGVVSQGFLLQDDTEALPLKGAGI